MATRKILLILACLLFCVGAQAREWLIDVRTPDEFAAEHAPGALNIEHQEIVAGARAKNIDTQDQVVLYCRSGRRAEMAKEALLKAGYVNVKNLGSVAQAKEWLSSRQAK